MINNTKYEFVLDDNDILAMLEFKANNENEKINNYLSDKLKKILLSA